MQQCAISTDAVTRSVVQSERGRAEFSKAWIKAGGTVDTVPSLVTPIASISKPWSQEGIPGFLVRKPKRIFPTPTIWPENEYQAWCTLPVQGVGIRCFGRDKIRNAWLVTTEGSNSGITLPARVLTQCTAIMVDVTLRSEYSDDRLAEAAEGKIRYYTPLREQVLALTDTHEVSTASRLEREGSGLLSITGCCWNSACPRLRR